MSDFHNLQEENRRLTAEVERLKAQLATALSPGLHTPPTAESQAEYLRAQTNINAREADEP